MKNLIKFIICTALVCGLSIGSAMAQTQDPKAVIENKVNEVIAMLDEASAQGLNAAQKTAKLEGIIYEVFDMTEMSKRALGANYNKFSDAEKKEFEGLFAEMLEDIYLGAIVDQYKGVKIDFGKTVELKPNEAVEIFSDINFSDGKKTPVSYRLSNKSGEWLVYDVIIEGISFIKNYRDQFRDLLTKNTPAQLLDTIRKKNLENDAG